MILDEPWRIAFFPITYSFFSFYCHIGGEKVRHYCAIIRGKHISYHVFTSGLLASCRPSHSRITSIRHMEAFLYPCWRSFLAFLAVFRAAGLRLPSLPILRELLDVFRSRFIFRSEALLISRVSAMLCTLSENFLNQYCISKPSAAYD